jgi:beta/gamma crystallin
MPAHAILFENADFQGNHKHVFDHIPNLSNQVDEFNFNDQTSSLVVLEGNWQFFKDWQWQNPWPNIVGPGVYVKITEALGASDANNSITGMRPVDPLGRAIPISELSHKITQRQAG